MDDLTEAVARAIADEDWPRTIAAGLSEAQKRYLDAVAASETPYEPRHGRTANWAIRRGLVATIVRLQDGREVDWDSLEVAERFKHHIVILGQGLSPLGLQVYSILESDHEPE